jgi:hypothetical protein
VADNTPDDFMKAMERSPHRPAPMPDATRGPIVALGAVIAAFGLYLMYAFVTQPMRGVPGAEFNFRIAAAAPVIITLGLMLMPRRAVDPADSRYEKIFVWMTLGTFVGGIALATWLRLFVF